MSLILKNIFSTSKKTKVAANLRKPLLIAGPCSAETEAQVMETIEGLGQQKVDIIRAGIWKPRTRPNCFEGIGRIGLQWLKNAGKAINKPVMVEVANAKHVEEALQMGIDILWIGARTTVNPFAVQEIADALKGVDIPVFVKNPVNPDLPLWIGAMERLNQAGIHRLGAIHRGVSTYGESKYRNRPQWEIPIELMRRLPDLPMICDPSHICGRRDLLLSVAQKAMDLNFDGLMIESHRNPDEAWSDASQQVTPEDYGEIIGQLVMRKTAVADTSFLHRLEDLRDTIEGIDRQVIETLAKRMLMVQEVGRIKKAGYITIFQPEHWDKTIRTRSEIGIKEGLTRDFMRELYDAIHKESIRHQTKVMN